MKYALFTLFASSLIFAACASKEDEPRRVEVDFSSGADSQVTIIDENGEVVDQ